MKIAQVAATIFIGEVRNCDAELIVEKKVLIEVKAVKALTSIHNAQVITYLKLTGCAVGLLLNFNVPILRHGIRRLLHPSLRNRDTETE